MDQRDEHATSSRRYPNPGFLGSPSGFAIFNQVQSMSQATPREREKSDDYPYCDLPSNIYMDQGVRHRATHVLNRLSGLDLVQLSNLVLAWLDLGANLALAERFLPGCVKAVVAYQWQDPSTPRRPETSDEHSISGRAESLTRNTCKTLILQSDSTVESYLEQMTGQHMRWETLGLFCAAAARAALDIPSFPSLYKNEEGRGRLTRSLSYIGDCCLEICLAVDCLNDVQIVLQYEHFHLHSQVHGDHSE